jgi:hypothetical protein
MAFAVFPAVVDQPVLVCGQVRPQLGPTLANLSDLTGSESVPPWYTDFVDVFLGWISDPCQEAPSQTPPLYPEKLEADQLLANGQLSPTKPGPAAQRSAAKSKRGIMREPLAYVLEQILR